MTRPFLLATALLGLAASSASAQSIALTLRDGRVTLITQNATPAAILAEWARQGQVRIVDGERLQGTPLTLRLENVPEREALDIVLRSAAGYIAAPRAQAATATLSRFDRVIVMTSSPGANAAARNTPAARPTAGAVVQNTPAPQLEEDAQAQQALVQEDLSPAAGAAPEQPVSSTNFDYANPQRYFAARQAEQQEAEAARQSATQPSASPMGSLGQTSSKPGVLPTPATPTTPGAATGAAPANPYGLPAGPTPGSSSTPSTLEPDRSKYINPYSPTPPRP